MDNAVEIVVDQERWSWSKAVRRNWFILYLFVSLLLHIGCLVALLLTETRTASPPSGSSGIVQLAAVRVMYTNILAMCLALLLDSFLYTRGKKGREEAAVVGEFEMAASANQAAQELRFMAKFSSPGWGTLFHYCGLTGSGLLMPCSCLLVPCALANFAALLPPTGTVPELATQVLRVCLAALGLTGLLAALLMVLGWMNTKYQRARVKLSASLQPDVRRVAADLLA